MLRQDLLIAIENHDLARVQALVRAGADINLPIGNLGGETPLIRAVAAGDLDKVQLLLQSGADVNLAWSGPKPWTPLMFAHDNPAMLQKLLAGGADVNARTSPHRAKTPLNLMKLGTSGETALHLAGLAGNTEAVKVLLEAGAEVEARADNGCAPLDYAIQRGTVTEAATVLVAAGAQLTPERLETMHAAAHSTETDLLMLPLDKLSSPIAQEKASVAGQNEPEKEVTSAEPLPPPPGELRCPTCHALIYSRRPKICGQCGALLPPELVLSDEQARALKEQRSWAQELADQFSALPAFASKDRKDIKPSTPAAHFFAAELLQRSSCAADFENRPRPSFWLYVIGYTMPLLVVSFLVIHLGAVPPLTLLVLAAFSGLLGYRAWTCASPICPNCHTNIRYCGAEFCHLCGRALSHRRCVSCGVDHSWVGLFRPYASGGNRGWIAHCPGCGVYLDTKVSRWRSGN